MKIRLEFKLQDMWIGAYWKKELEIGFRDMTWIGISDGRKTFENIAVTKDGKLYYDIIRRWYQHIWICVVPCLPIHISWKIK